MVREMASLGFEWIELSHGIRLSLIPGILKALQEGIAKVSSVHNFCPLPTGVLHAAPNLYEPTGPDPRERDQWLRHTVRTIEFAAQVGADRVVVHGGSIRTLFFNPGSRLERLRKVRRQGSGVSFETLRTQVERALLKLQRKARKSMGRLSASLERILPLAEEKEIALGLENREGISELPMDAEMAPFLKQHGDTPALGYWHDVGHAQIKDQLGMIDHSQFLLENHKRALGFHLHDVNQNGRDHLPIGQGTIDFDMVRSFFRPEHVLVLEIGPSAETSEVLASRDYLF